MSQMTPLQCLVMEWPAPWRFEYVPDDSGEDITKEIVIYDAVGCEVMDLRSLECSQMARLGFAEMMTIAVDAVSP